MNPLLRRGAPRSRARIRAEAPTPRDGGSGVASLRLYDPIDSWGEWFGVSAREFVGVLDELPADTTEIQLLINSPGGEVWEGLAILNALRAHPARVVAVVEGIAASAASFIAAGVDELVMAQNSELFVHRAWGVAIGNAEDLNRLAADLTHEDRNLASIYARKAGDDVENWLAAMGAETWYSAEEAVDAGLADRVLEQDATDNVAAARARFDLTVLASQNAAPRSTTTAASARGATAPTERSRAVAFTDDQLATMRRELGLTDDASEDTIVQALSEALAERADDTAETPEPVAARLPEGVVAVDRTQWEALQASARRGDEARAQQEHADRLATVNAAVEDGRITASRRDHWVGALAADPGAGEVLAGLAPGLVPVEARGHDGNPQHEAVDDSWFPGVPTTTAVREG